MQERIRGNEYRVTTVCVDSYNNSVPEGRFYNSYLKAGKKFHGLVEFLLSLGNTLEEMNFPQASTITRSFNSGVCTSEVLAEAVEPQIGALATFAVKVIFRQNSSWQGSVSWLEGKTEQSFRSVLELIFLMDSALRSPDHN